MSEEGNQKPERVDMPLSPAPKKKPRLKPTDFEFLGILGEGAYAKVMLAERKSDKMRYAIKVVNKRFITRNNKVETVMNEKKILSVMDHPNVVKLHFTFQDQENLYYVLSLASNGELFDDLQRVGGSYDVPTTKFYGAELVNILSYLHHRGIVHRDLKPENILLDKNRHLKLTDFGTAKLLDPNEDAKRKKSFVGSADYVSPEVLSDSPASEPADIWAFGCILYKMLTGHVPFRGDSEYLTFRKIEQLDIRPFPDNFDPIAKELILSILVKDPSARPNVDLLKKHKFFESIEWSSLHQATAPNPATVKGMNDGDVSDDESADEELLTAPDMQNHYTEEKHQRAASSAMSRWEPFLMEGEQIVYTGLITKRRGMFAKKRQLILTNFPRFIYIDTVKMIQKGTIPWVDTLWGEVKTPRQFYIHIPTRSYYMVGLSSGARAWVDQIEMVKKIFTGENHYFEIPTEEL